MPIPRIENLRADIWATLTFDQRLGALQELENRLAEQEGREPCQIAPIPEDELKDKDRYRGEYISSNDGPGVIRLNPNLISSDEPYQAVETFFHEARHAYQVYAVQHPEIHDNPEEVEDWRKTKDGGYIEYKEPNLSIDHYRWQPVEADANNIARERTDELYSSTFQDNEKYPAYKSEKEQELSDDVEHAQMILGENYQEKARQEMIEKYQKNLENQESLSEAHAESVGEASLENEGIAPSDSPPSASESESEDYNYGYGY